MPVAITVGGKDTLALPGSVRRLAEVPKKLNRPAPVVYRENGGHSTNNDDGRTILEFAIRGRPPATYPATTQTAR
jgi:hypothetical protein